MDNSNPATSLVLQKEEHTSEILDSIVASYDYVDPGNPMDLPIVPKEEIRKFTKKLDLAENTMKSYLTNWYKFIRWCKEKEIDFLPATHETLEEYFVTLMYSDKSMSVINASHMGIKTFHKYHKFEDPTKTIEFKDLMRKIRRFRKGDKVAQKKPLTERLVIEAILKNNETTLPGRWGHPFESAGMKEKRCKKDTALLWFMHSTGMRRSEVCNAEWAHVHEKNDGSGEGWIEIPFSKTDQYGDGQVAALSKETMKTLREWFEVAPKNQKYSHRIFGTGFDKWIIERFKRLMKQIGEDPKEYSGHSGRVGMATHMTDAGASLQDTMGRGRWKDPASVMRYVRGREITSTNKYFK